ncbi:MAG: cytidylate kinase family protein, partial [Thermoprotei archaeon]
RQVDARSLREADKGNVVIEGHLTGWVIEKADLKIYLNAPLEVRAKRIAERESISIDDATKQTQQRELSEKERFKKIYGFNLDSFINFDLVINTSIYDLHELLDVIINAILKSKPLKGVAVQR